MAPSAVRRILESTRVLWSVLVLGVAGLLLYFMRESWPEFGPPDPAADTNVWGVILWLLLLYAVLAAQISRPLAADPRVDRFLARGLAALPAVPVLNVFVLALIVLVEQGEIMPGDLHPAILRHLVFQPTLLGLFGAGFLALRGRGSRFERGSWLVGATFATLFMVVYPYLNVDGFVVNEYEYTLTLFLPFLLFLPLRVFQPRPRPALPGDADPLPPVLPPTDPAPPRRTLR
ncbi:MAG: hypothetical protein HYT80_02940 [Euryarchaeota archaeon]|nr:hypothetical protein [Euryarchaeota archaeon]